MAGLAACRSHVTHRIGLAALLVFFGSENLQTAIADGDTRTLTMHHTHTGEDITITFKRNGRYDDAALQKLNWFLRDWRRDEPTKMDPHLFDVVWEVYSEVGAKQPVQIVSAFRSAGTNAMLRRRSRGVARFSQHILGKAMDFYIPDAPLEDIRIAGLRLQRGGVGFYPTSGSPFVHLDTGSVRHWPRMTHDQLARVFPNGRTAHLPTDGRPLSGYGAALAEIERRGGSAGAGASGEERTALAQRPKRGILERLFGFGEDDEDEGEATSRTGHGHAVANAAPAPAAAPPVVKRQQLASVIPLPPIRPAPPTQGPGRPGGSSGFSLASESSRPAPAPTPSPADIVRTRGVWTADAALEAPTRPNAAAAAPPAPPAPGAIGRDGQRFAWLTGPADHPVVERSAAPVQASDAPRPPADVPNVDPDVTAGISPWPELNDRVRSDVALAYAAAPAAPDIELPRATPAPMARVTPQATSVQPRTAVTSASAKPGQRFDNPWLRGLMIAPSVYYSMNVASFGAPDYRQLARFMHKPTDAIAMRFAADPNPGLAPQYFTGPAIAFLPVIRFMTRTAGLN